MANEFTFKIYYNYKSGIPNVNLEESIQKWQRPFFDVFNAHLLDFKTIFKLRLTIIIFFLDSLL
jgi:hypothetical protein